MFANQTISVNEYLWCDSQVRTTFIGIALISSQANNFLQNGRITTLSPSSVRAISDSHLSQDEPIELNYTFTQQRNPTVFKQTHTEVDGIKIEILKNVPRLMNRLIVASHAPFEGI